MSRGILILSQANAVFSIFGGSDFLFNIIAYPVIMMYTIFKEKA